MVSSLQSAIHFLLTTAVLLISHYPIINQTEPVTLKVSSRHSECLPLLILNCSASDVILGQFNAVTVKYRYLLPLFPAALENLR